VLQAVAAAAKTDGSPAAAEKILAAKWVNASAQSWKRRAFALAKALNTSCLGGGGRWGGMAVLQSQDPSLGLPRIDTPLSDKDFFSSTFRAMKNLTSVAQRRAALAAIVDWEDPGHGGYYNNLGAVPRSPRLSSGFGPQADPQYLYAPLVAASVPKHAALAPPTFAGVADRLSWSSYAQTYHDEPLELVFDGLNCSAAYSVRLTYSVAGERSRRLAAVSANGSEVEVHGYFTAEQTQPFEFAVPRAATEGGTLRLRCHGPAGTGGSGRCCQIAEVWVLRRG